MLIGRNSDQPSPTAEFGFDRVRIQMELECCFCYDPLGYSANRGKRVSE
jgi:hypothetical protein